MGENAPATNLEMPANQNPEQVARDRVDRLLTDSGWAVQDKKAIDFNTGPGVASASQVGKPAAWNNEIENCCFQNTVIRHRPFLPSIGPYLPTLYKHFYSTGVFAKVAAGFGINHLSANKFASIAIPLAPLAEQSIICARVESQLSALENLESNIDTKLAKAEALRQSILKKAFSGQLVSQDANDKLTSSLFTENSDRVANRFSKPSRNPKPATQARSLQTQLPQS